MNFSRLLPPTAALIPVTILSAFGAEALISRGLQKQPFKPLLGAIVVTATLLAIVILSGFIFNNNVFSGNMNGTVIFLIVFVICLFCLQVTKTKPFLLFLGMVIPAIFFQQPMMLQQDRQTLIHSSPVITELKKHLPEDSRFASVSPELNFLPPNRNVIFGLKSVHTYIPLSSTRYHQLVKELGGEMGNAWRWNHSINPNFDSPFFWMSNIGAIISMEKLNDNRLKYISSHNDIHVYSVANTMGMAIEFPLTDTKSAELESLKIGDPRTLNYRRISKIKDNGDQLEFSVSPDAESVILLSQIYHPKWSASSWNGIIWSQVKTIQINEIFQGAIAPKGSQKYVFSLNKMFSILHMQM